MIRPILAALLALLLVVPGALAADDASRPNIVWIVGEDASANVGCYEETTIQTPHLDQMARRGVRFTSAFVTCPVCSPSRSAMVAGMFQTTLGAHNHRSQSQGGKAGGNTAYYDSYRLPAEIKLIPQLFQEAGYYTSLGSGPSCNKFGKTDYNFIYDSSVYNGADWRDCPKGKPFFAQIMLRGGKNRRARQHGTDPADVSLPPYYPDHPVLREDRADYLNSWVQMDQEVGQILQSLQDEGVAEDTVVFFWTDHGVSHLRGKQFLYEEGIRVPLIVQFGDGRLAGKVRDDLTLHIDVAATSLALAGIEAPQYLQGQDLFAEDSPEREMIFSARDRCDETVDIIRCVRTPRFKYIRNFLSHQPHAQSNQYKDGKQIIKTMRQLHAAGKLNDLQGRPFEPRRPTEELYDLEKDPHETVNLAARPEYADTVERLRGALYDWMIRSRDVGLIPEPILEELGRRHGNKYYVLQQPESRGLVQEIIAVIEAGEGGDVERLLKGLRSDRASVRYWAATWLGEQGDASHATEVDALLEDDSPAVQVAAALACCKLGQTKKGAKALAARVAHDNLLTGMYAIRALEQIGKDAELARQEIENARQSRYEFTRRIARRLTSQLSD